MRVAFFALLFVSVSAFSSSPFGTKTKKFQGWTFLKNARVDSSEAIRNALETAKKYGSASQEARVAWEAVEEMDSSDNSNAYKGGVSEEECLMTESESAACEEYGEKMAQLSSILEEQKSSIEKVKSLAEEIQAVKLKAPGIITPSPDTPEMRAALNEANRITKEKGLDSNEAKLAWEAVEEVAESDLSEVAQGSLEDECLIETIEACQAMEELSRVINLSKNKSRYSG